MEVSCDTESSSLMLSFVVQDIIYSYVRNALVESDLNDICT